VPNLDKIMVTKYWLLGFIEGEGNFSAESKSLALKFRLGQVYREKVLYACFTSKKKIALFLGGLARNYKIVPFLHLILL
jgi:hypothetical protein